MSRHPIVSMRWLAIVSLVALLAGLAGCSGQQASPVLAPSSPSVPATAPTAPAPTATPVMRTFASPAPAGAGQPTQAATQGPAPTVAGAASAQPAQATPATATGDLPARAFRYEITLRPAQSSDQGSVAPVTLITGQYLNGAWQQTVKTEDAESQESVVAGGATYTRPNDQEGWTRWPTVGFDDAYGLTSPFSVLRLYSQAQQRSRGTSDAVTGVTEPTTRTQVLIAAATIKNYLKTGVAAAAPDAASQADLEEQVAPMAVQQTITYWVGASGRIYRAAATLLAADTDGKATPWMETTWRFWDYDAASIAVTVPTKFTEGTEEAASDAEATPSAAELTAQPTDVAANQSAPTNLIVSVFAWPGKPADDIAVTVYQAGDAQQPVDWRAQAASQFNLPPGRYDVRVQMNYAEEWLRGVDVTADGVVKRDVTFDFGTLELSVLRNGTAVPVDIVTYPAGDRQNWVDWRSDNPASFLLRSGTYDVEISYDDHKSTQTITGLVIRPGETTKKQVDLKP